MKNTATAAARGSYHICFLSGAHPPRDKRVFDKEAVSLAAAGFKVTHVAPGPPESTFERGVWIRTYPSRVGIAGRLVQLPRLFVRGKDTAADCFHCNELESWLVGLALRVTTGAQVIFDVHEDYPSVFGERRNLPGWMQRLVGAVVRVLYRTLGPRTTRIVLAKRTLASDFSHSTAKQVLVQNFTSIEQAQSSTAHVHLPGGTLRMIHLGLLNRVRGWPQLLEAFARMRSDGMLEIIGKFDDDSEPDFHARARDLGISERIRMAPWLPFPEAFSRIIAADVGLVLFQPGIQNHVFALPHKLFDYMLAGLPVIVPAFAVEVAEIVRRAECGILVDVTNPDVIAAALDTLASDHELRRRLGDNGRKAVQMELNWEAEARRLIQMYDAISGEARMTAQQQAG